MLNYQLSFLIPNLIPKQREELLKRIGEEIKRLNGKIENKFIERRFFAYPVKKQNEGFMGVVNFSIESEKLKDLDNFLKLNKDLLRKMIEKREMRAEALIPTRRERKPILAKKQVKKVKIEELDKKLDEILK